ncbi:hypothetical protein J4216_01215 [Candidatus Woesearchaeota archaeon]|nr:hypothetical protein [Candidatus Woesearchaeota archaeon]
MEFSEDKQLTINDLPDDDEELEGDFFDRDELDLDDDELDDDFENDESGVDSSEEY